MSFSKDDVLENKSLTLAGMTMTFEGFLQEAEEEFKNLDEQLQKSNGPFFAGDEVVCFTTVISLFVKRKKKKRKRKKSIHTKVLENYEISETLEIKNFPGEC